MPFPFPRLSFSGGGEAPAEGEVHHQLLGAIDAGLTARLALVFARVGLDALGTGSAGNAEAGIIEAGVAALDASTTRSTVTSEWTFMDLSFLELDSCGDLRSEQRELGWRVTAMA